MGKLNNCILCDSIGFYQEDNDHHGEWFDLGCSNKKCKLHWLYTTEDISDKEKAIQEWNKICPNQKLYKNNITLDDYEFVSLRNDVLLDALNMATHYLAYCPMCKSNLVIRGGIPNYCPNEDCHFPYKRKQDVIIYNEN